MGEGYIEPTTRGSRRPVPPETFPETHRSIADAAAEVSDVPGHEGPGVGADEAELDGGGTPDVALEDLTRDELNERASAVGVEDPEKLANKGEVIDAIEKASA